jgi:hypothetical protein
MRRWTEASFDAVAEFDHDLNERVVWLNSSTAPQRGQDASGSRHPVLAAFGRSAARLGRATAVVGAGCLVVGLLPNSALAPVSPAVASIRMTIDPPQPVSIELPAAPAIAAPSLEELSGDAQRAEVDDFLRFGSRDLPRRLVETILRAAGDTGVDPIYLMALADKESSFRTSVKASTSSAQGLFQFIERTWLDTVRTFGAKHGMDAQVAAITIVDDKPTVADEAMRNAILDLRNDPYLAAVMAAEMLKRDAAQIGFKIGRSLTPTEMYLAHFLGLDDATRFINMRNTKKAASATKAFPAAAKANVAIFFEKKKKGKRGLSVPEVYARIDEMIDSRLSRYQDVKTYASAEPAAQTR